MVARALSWIALVACGCGPVPEPQITGPSHALAAGAAASEGDSSGPGHWRGKCEEGDGQICYLLGENYSRGGSNAWGYFPQSDEQAAEFYAKGCKLGSPDACGQLGRALLKGTGVSQDLTRGAALVVSACEHGSRWACFHAGVALYDGTGIGRDRERARRLLRAGCTDGNPGACGLERDLFGTGAPSETDPPAGAVGVAFGTPLSDVAARCRSAGYAWKGDSGGGYCGGGLSKTLPLPFVVTACNGRVCSLLAIEPLAQGAPAMWLRRFDAVEKDLVARYGPPAVRVRTLPDACSAPDDFARCVADGRAVYETDWGWQANFGVGLALSVRDFGPNISILYRSPESTRQNSTEGL
jgi:hypothetical protein